MSINLLTRQKFIFLPLCIFLKPGISTDVFCLLGAILFIVPIFIADFQVSFLQHTLLTIMSISTTRIQSYLFFDFNFSFHIFMFSSSMIVRIVL
jgi:hypothetical protein